MKCRLQFPRKDAQHFFQLNVALKEIRTKQKERVVHSTPLDFSKTQYRHTTTM